MRFRPRRRRPTVRVTQHGDPLDDGLLFVLGWGNKPSHRSVQWLIDRLTYDGYRVHAVELPTNGWEFEQQYVAPVRAYAVDRNIDLVLSHSTGGLVASHLDLAVRNVFLSPWWGMALSGVGRLLYPLVSRLPTTRPIVPSGISRTDLGEMKLAAEVADTPDTVSPAFLRMIRSAQQTLPPFRETDVVFFTPTDRVVDVRSIGERTPAANLVPYDGGHEFFASEARERTFSKVLTALEDGPDAFPSVKPNTIEALEGSLSAD
ncbi:MULTISPECIES: alpha/beta hydrolase [Haloferax]|uniref:Alpha/beta fold hydrolase n=2 Tax=Haloferax TaxID=2251 RepID=A0A6G1Z3E0_9EURY|nr:MULTISPECIES: alpha/beta hydrolase [Haloferax]KAB1188374.1 alpha/beta hydrolase [Haloferax sp. CBA1149]MRW81066.1 alpha/beta fold hydrolase [Haloferax marinisediminis]